ncbi:hypothetical protein AgCh_021727 [Apium graveolens]
MMNFSPLDQRLSWKLWALESRSEDKKCSGSCPCTGIRKIVMLVKSVSSDVKFYGFPNAVAKFASRDIKLLYCGSPEFKTATADEGMLAVKGSLLC